MRRLGLTLTALALTVGIAFASPIVPAYAADTDVLQQACESGNASNSPTCDNSATSENPLTGKDGMLLRITQFIALIAGIAAVLIIIISGMRYISSAGDTQKAVGARNALIGALVGLVIIALADVIIVAIIKGFL